MTVTFQVMPNGEKAPNANPFVSCHMVFDIKIKNFHRRACLVVGGYVTHTLDVITNSSVVTCETVHVVFTLAVLHGL